MSYNGRTETVLTGLWLILMAGSVTFAAWTAFGFLDFQGRKAAGIQKLSEIRADDFRWAWSDEETALRRWGWVDVSTLIPDLDVRMVYAGPDNFIGRSLSPDLRRAMLHPAAAGKLKRAATELAFRDSSLRIVVLDAGRPAAVQKALWDVAVQSGTTRYVASPNRRSVHQYGMAVDVTLAGPDTLLDMGTVHDYFGPEAEPRYHAQMLREGRLTERQVQHRELLRSVMLAAGFQAIDTEWWHFNAASRNYCEMYLKAIP